MMADSWRTRPAPALSARLELDAECRVRQRGCRGGCDSPPQKPHGTESALAASVERAESASRPVAAVVSWCAAVRDSSRFRSRSGEEKELSPALCSSAARARSTAALAMAALGSFRPKEQFSRASHSVDTLPKSLALHFADSLIGVLYSGTVTSCVRSSGPLTSLLCSERGIRVGLSDRLFSSSSWVNEANVLLMLGLLRQLCLLSNVFFAADGCSMKAMRDQLFSDKLYLASTSFFFCKILPIFLSGCFDTKQFFSKSGYMG